MDLPLYRQIVNELMEGIASGKYPPGAKLPTEEELSGTHFVSRITSRRALDELAAMGYAVRNRRTGTFVRRRVGAFPPSVGEAAVMIGLVFPFNPNSYDATAFLSGILSVTDERECHTVVQNSNHQYKNERSIIERFIRDGIKGIIYYPFDSLRNYNLVLQLAAQRYPLVTIDKTFGDADCPSVVSDNYAGAYRTTSHLIEMGHRDIAFLSDTGIAPISSVKLRYKGYVSAMTAHGLPVNPVLCCEARHTGGMPPEQIAAMIDHYVAFAQHFLAQGATAVQCSTDGTALLLAQACARIGVAIPDRLSVCGYDNLPGAAEMGLTTTRQDLTSMGRAAAELLLEMMENPGMPPKSIVLPVEFVQRSSVRRV